MTTETENLPGDILLSSGIVLKRMPDGQGPLLGKTIYSWEQTEEGIGLGVTASYLNPGKLRLTIIVIDEQENITAPKPAIAHEIARIFFGRQIVKGPFTVLGTYQVVGRPMKERAN